jgi:glycoprotein endo-alpha-1,2-mannosidase
MKKYLINALLIFTLFITVGSAQSRHSKTSIYKSYKGLIMAGYQGWFNAPDDGANRGWNHYKSQGTFGPGSVKVDLWPDVSEYKKVYKTPFVHADGSEAFLFSSYDASSVDLHFKWMKEYGVDGVFVQRFIGQVRKGRNRDHNNRVLSNALAASQKYGRAISVMYDLSGMRDSIDVSVLINDWKNLVDSLKITSQGNKQTYLYHNGKPLVALWGVGFAGRKYSLRSIEHVMDFLKNDPVYGGCSILLGIPTYWRELRKDADTNPYLHDVLRKADIIHPWTVGRYNNISDYAEYQNILKDDISWCKQNKVDYVPVVFPGFTWHNMYPKSPSNQIPRNRGQFYWSQLSGAIGAGAEMIYVAMFDEIDEGTAIFKVSKNPPVGQSPFVSFEEGIPSDYYLYLTGYAAKMLRKEIPFQSKIPLPKL